jgi:phage recombination protein Bet
MSSKELTTTNGALDFTKREVIQTLKATVAQGLSDAEFALFAEHCKGTGLNPFKKEVWAIKAGGRLQIMTGLQGYLSIANSHPQYDGMEVEVDNDEKPTKAICRVYRKDRKFPAEGVALFKEYGKSTPIWQQMPRVMLTKVAKSIALREAFPQELNGTYTAEEMPAEYDEPKARRPTVIPANELAPSVANDPLPDANIDQRPDNEKRNASAVYVYDIRNIPQTKRKIAEALLQGANATWDDDEMCWFSSAEIPKLVNYLRKNQEEARA